MSLDLRRRAELSQDQVAALDKAMSAFYNNPPPSYYKIADRVAQQYMPSAHPFHCDFVARMTPGTTVLEVGCGTAHLCHYVQEKGGHYAGLDYSEKLLQENRRRFPSAQFFEIGSRLNKTFDIVASLYALEHVADPPVYLESLWQFCRAGGLIGIICPKFVGNPGIAPGVFYGRTPRRLREKLQTLNIDDAIDHLIDLKIRVPRWKKEALASPPGAFWMNLRPRVLYGADYSIDADAIHFPQLKDVVWFYKQKGGEIVQTSDQMPEVLPEVWQFNCYALIRKPGQPG